MIRVFQGRAWRYIEAYANGKTTPEAIDIVKFSARKYKSHRRIGVHDCGILPIWDQGLGDYK
ncbi:hypothetical protein BX666DRAFT_70323 [Dichotomocladium elegans]|nr:hypothetical protein BX666DRAFT_70323 [Dichotomocladium elegans]